MGVQETEGGGEGGKREQSQVSFCRLNGIYAASLILQTNSLALYISSHICAVPIELPAPAGKSRVSPLPHHSQLSLLHAKDIYSLSVDSSACYLSFSLFSFFS